MKKQKLFSALIMAVILVLSACGSDSSQNNSANSNGNKESQLENTNTMDENMDMNEDMDMHSGSGEVPKYLEVAKNPKFEVGSHVIIDSDHMKGMKGAKATVVGAYNTIAYVVSYTPTTGGEKVNNHKWVIQEEIKNVGDKKLKPGTKVTIEAGHMKGMNGATATIQSGKKTTIYMVDYTPTTGGEKVENHKWVIESELSPVEG